MQYSFRPAPVAGIGVCVCVVCGAQARAAGGTAAPAHAQALQEHLHQRLAGVGIFKVRRRMHAGQAAWAI